MLLPFVLHYDFMRYKSHENQKSLSKVPSGFR